MRGQRFAAGVDGTAAHEERLEGERMPEAPRDLFQDVHGAVGDLGTDAVARENGDVFVHDRSSSDFRSPPASMIF